MNEIIQLTPRNEEQEQKLNSLKTYTEKYDFLINYYKTYNGTLTMYCEKHHIIPRSLGGTNDLKNIVILPADMHYLAHYFLPLMYEEQNNEIGRKRMLNAFILFKNRLHISDTFNTLLSECKEYSRLRSEAIELIRQRQIELFSDPIYREANRRRNIQRYIDNPELRKECSFRAKKWMKEKPESFKKMIESHIIAMKRPEVRKKISEIAKNRFKDPEFIRKYSLAQKKRYKNPEEREKAHQLQLGRIRSDESKSKQSKTARQRYINNPELRKRNSRTGKSNGMYGRRGSLSPASKMVWIKNELTGESKYVSKFIEIPEGWVRGRIRKHK